jgi:DNA-binding response OmpR family regulator
VLVVEDDPDLGDAIVTFLKEEGLDAKLARDGDQAMRLLDQLHPSAMILDLMMPRRDGFSVLRELRADGRIGNLPVIVVTELGAADYVTKPFELDELLERVRNVLASRTEEPTPHTA